MRYGLHELAVQPVEYSMCLRDPAERLRSLFRWLSDRPTPRRPATIQQGFEAFVFHSGIAAVDNGLTRVIAGLPDVAGERVRRPVTESDYEVARARMVGAPVVGVTDELEGYVTRLARRYGWGSDLRLPHVHQSRTPLEVSPGLMEAIRERNEWDLRLYLEARVA